MNIGMNVGLAVFTSVCGVSIGVFWWWRQRRDRALAVRLRREGVVTHGVVRSVSASGRYAEFRTVVIDLVDLPGRPEIVRTVGAPEAAAAGLVEGERIVVRHDPADPTIAVLDAMAPAPGWIPWAVGLFIVVLGLVTALAV
jgi:hypothetical protein